MWCVCGGEEKVGGGEEGGGRREGEVWCGVVWCGVVWCGVVVVGGGGGGGDGADETPTTQCVSIAPQTCTELVRQNTWQLDSRRPRPDDEELFIIEG